MSPASQGESSLSRRSCIRCNQRKVGCDRKQPCSRCLKAGAECIHSGNKRAPRKLKRPPISKILVHLQELEHEVERLRSTPAGLLFETANQSAVSPYLGTGTNRLSNWEEAEAPRGRLVVRDGQSRYVGDEATVILGDKIRELQEICDRSSDEESVTDATSTNIGPISKLSVGILGTHQSAGSDTSGSQYLQRLQVQALWHVYRENVAPMIAILHTPSIEAMLREGYANKDSILQPEQEALILAICFAAVVSMTPQQSLSILGGGHDAYIHKYRVAVERALAGANLISTQDMRVLQAAVLFLLCLRRCCDSRLVWAEAAIVVRVAQRQGMHRDGQRQGLTPFEIEMRRRLWWHICILDMLCSEDQGTDTQIWPGMFDTKLPSNIDGDEVTPGLTTLPPLRRGYTDITLCIIHCEMMSNLYWAGKSLDEDARQPSTSEKEKLLSTLANRLEVLYLHNFDLDIPIQWVTVVIARLTLSKGWLVHRLNASTAGRDPAATNDEIFHMAVEIVKFATLIQNNESTSQWAWLCKSYKQRHVVAYILSELCVRPVTPETEHAWEVVTEIYHQWLREDRQTNTMLQKPLSRLMERAALARRTKLAGAEASGGRSVAAPSDNAAIDRVQGTLQPAVSQSIIPPPNVLVGTDMGVRLEDPSAAVSEGHILDTDANPSEVTEFSFSALDWLTGPLP
ncbi:hypothetical protein KXW73_004022 [Aspergillus fumigatus]|nr:hypothetical protein KXW73_004022 [Aspergillus fumigatus]